MRGISHERTWLESGTSGIIMELNTITHPILKIFDPIILPKAISLCPLKAETSEAANYGRLVPTETMVKEITRSEIPKD